MCVCKQCIACTCTCISVASRVLQRTGLKLQGNTLYVEAPKVFKWDEKSVEVHGVDDSVSMKVLELLFESRKKTGGGPITGIDKHDGFVVVHFQHSPGNFSVLYCEFYFKWQS